MVNTPRHFVFFIVVCAEVFEGRGSITEITREKWLAIVDKAQLMMIKYH